MAHYKGAASEAGRAMQLMKKREIAQQEIELRKKKIEDDLKIDNIENKFATHYDAVEQQLKTSTIGLVTLNEMKAKQENIVKERERKLAQKEREKEQEKERALAAKQAEKNKQKRQIQALSFDLNEDEDGEEGSGAESDAKSETSVASNQSKGIDDKSAMPLPKKIKKNPDVDTSFLPDREREEEENRLREELRQEWATKQNVLKEEEIEITFSYWDGSGHRRSVVMKKGNSIYQLLQRCLEVLRREFSELKTVMADQLMYVKEDLILPHHYTFYDFIVTKARGKSGPLFTFDVHDDVRMMHDASVETEESHAGKVLLRSWYERNKHIFPASRWEPYDPTKSYDKYTVSDKNKKKDKV
ncbi:protein FAM50 homolog [Neodiprion pinetum]|uniref:Protein FAM50 homolog n=1 Tax=Neodiprion lecontei TaxID=441921 RepID=A0A6J0C3L4_NEOLC|nr:protein FAM50 homolog [Neodiprion lecontei]XP_015521861.1 protein FAM50 homolog [Neodiprion lecontei]XP_046423676.1 protein FAM50 homolog [Neodiprion fabricii]XP_046423677.1 protein FAM50 homolog [Neodiprion fabricii]XP_046480012.1 protein FAM50 homolog [Neodiprion pinetum]XP_046480013.1 protein FAM50 homolog [Neodiprion pinetum]XP_046617523.1 protein FAM50 homolog [Neodiprion virginianus]XP_046617524.1 protein FAM50 homolog [Neodiprion virginianus]